MAIRAWKFINRWWFFVPVVLVYVGLWALPADLWFHSRAMTVSNSKFGDTPTVLEDRTIRFSFYGRYKTITRNAKTHDTTSCMAEADFPYIGGLDGVRTITLTAWTNDDLDCSNLPPGDYYTQTCRTVLYPVWGLIPPKTMCITSNVFTISE